VFIEPTAKLNARKPFIQRLDGLWFKPEQMAAGMNRGIHAAYDAAAVVVWQSEFDMKMSTRWFGDRAGRIIPNGIEVVPATLRSEAFAELRTRYQKVFVCSSNWHPQKRLIDNITAFRAIRASQHPSSCLIVLGSNPDVQVADKDIFYAGSIRHDLCAELYSIADWMIHLAWLDHCPNVVVEAISQGCPVICSSEGGTKELVGERNGVVIQDTVEYKFDLVDYDNPPRVASSAVPQLPERFKADPSSVDIVKCAKAYEDALKFAVAT
jgi:glycosyltransferase involved in cell wall biosynthesis